MFALTCRCSCGLNIGSSRGSLSFVKFFVRESCSVCYHERWETPLPTDCAHTHREDALNSRIKPDPITGAATVDRTPLRSGMAPDCQLDTMFWKPDAEHFPLVLHCDVTCKAMIDLIGPAFSSQEPVSWDLRDLAMAHAYKSTTTRPSVLGS
jgi:hypothetical protein